MSKRKKKKQDSIFPPETGENKLPSPALQDPAIAASISSNFAGLGSVGSINEEVGKLLVPEKIKLKEAISKLIEDIQGKLNAE